MTIRAEHGHVRARQWKPRISVPRQRELRWFETLQVVAGFTTVLMGWARKLAFVNVFVTILALRLGDLE